MAKPNVNDIEYIYYGLYKPYIIIDVEYIYYG